MWTATLIHVSKVAGVVSFFVEFRNGDDKFVEEYTSASLVDTRWLKNQVRSKLVNLTNSYTFADSLVLNTEVDTSDEVIPVEVQETNEWVADYRRLTNAQRLVDLGVLTGAEAAFVTLKNKVKTNFKNSYLNNL